MLRAVYARASLARLHGPAVYDVAHIRTVMATLPPPRDAVEAAHHRYRARLSLFPWWYALTANAAAIPLLLAAWLRARRPRRAPTMPGEPGPVIVVQTNKPLPAYWRSLMPADLVPPDVDPPVLMHDAIPATPGPAVRALVAECRRRYPLGFYFRYLVGTDLARVSTLTSVPGRSVIAYDGERNVANPLAAKLCEDAGCAYVGVMHGNYRPNLTMAYLAFTRYYAWDQCFVDQFTGLLGCDPRQFVVAPPLGFLRLDLPAAPPDPAYLTYYLSGESEAQLRCLRAALDRVAARHGPYRVRLHPTWAWNDVVRRCFDPAVIEDPGLVGLPESLAGTRHAAGLNSSALVQAHFSGRALILDDVSSPAEYAGLVEQAIFPVVFPHRRLSEVAGG